MQHDSHEFMMYLFGSLQDEETPIEGSKFDGSDESKSLTQLVEEYSKSHPSIIDRLFSGKIFYCHHFYRYAKDNSDLWKVQ